MDALIELAVYFDWLMGSNFAFQVVHQVVSRVHADLLAAARAALASSPEALVYSVLAAAIFAGLISFFPSISALLFYSALPTILPIVPSNSPAIVPFTSSRKSDTFYIQPKVFSSIQIVSSAIPDFREQDIYDVPCRLAIDFGRPVVSLGRPTFNHRSDGRSNSSVEDKGNGHPSTSTFTTRHTLGDYYVKPDNDDSQWESSSSSMHFNIPTEWTVPCAPFESNPKSRVAWFKSALAKCWSAYLKDQKWRMEVWLKVFYSAWTCCVYVFNAIQHCPPLLFLAVAAKSGFAQLCSIISAASKNVTTAAKESWNLALALPQKLVRQASSPQTTSKQLSTLISAVCTCLSKVATEQYARSAQVAKALTRGLVWQTFALIVAAAAAAAASPQGAPAPRQRQHRVHMHPDDEKFIIFDAGSKEASTSGRVHPCLLLWLKLRRQYKDELLPAGLREVLELYLENAEEATEPEAFAHSPCTLLLSSKFSPANKYNVQLLGKIENELAQRIKVEWLNFEWFLVFDDAALSFEWVETLPSPASTHSHEVDGIANAQSEQASVAVSITAQVPEQIRSSQATEPSLLVGSTIAQAPQSSPVPVHSSDVGNASSNSVVPAVEPQAVEQVIEPHGPLAAEIRDSAQAVEPHVQLAAQHEAVQVVESSAPAEAVEPFAPAPAVEPRTAQQVLESSAPAEAVEPSAPAEAVEPSAPAEAVEPSAPAEAVEPRTTQHEQLVEPFAPAEAVEPSAPAEAVEPRTAQQVVEPSAPAEAVEPSAPAQAVEPFAPANAVESCTTQHAQVVELRMAEDSPITDSDMSEAEEENTDDLLALRLTLLTLNDDSPPTNEPLVKSHTAEQGVVPRAAELDALLGARTKMCQGLDSAMPAFQLDMTEAPRPAEQGTMMEIANSQVQVQMQMQAINWAAVEPAVVGQASADSLDSHMSAVQDHDETMVEAISAPTSNDDTADMDVDEPESQVAPPTKAWHVACLARHSQEWRTAGPAKRRKVRTRQQRQDREEFVYKHKAPRGALKIGVLHVVLPLSLPHIEGTTFNKPMYGQAKRVLRSRRHSPLRRSSQ